jgi:hypothetical protein
MWASSPGPGRGATFGLEIPLVTAIGTSMPLSVPLDYIPAP